MDRIFLRLRYLLPGYRRRLSAQERCTLKMIPTELVDMILEYLRPESAIAFALTCRALFVKHFPKSAAAQLSAPARATLLQWLEQDIPRLYFCHGCACLHRWRATLQFSGASDTSLWPAQFRSGTADGILQHRPVGSDHLVLARADADARELRP